MPPKNFKVLVVEDETDVRELLKLHLNRESFDVIETDDGDEALKILAKDKFDLIVLDWMLPSQSGLDVCKSLRSNLKITTPVLMLTARADTLDKVVGLEMGADDYLTKPFEVREFVARAKALIRRASQSQNSPIAGAHGATPDQLKHGPFEVLVDEKKFFLSGAELSLTAGEIRMMQIFIENAGKSLDREWLIKNIQGEDVSVVDRTIDTRILGLRKKLGPHAEWIETVRGFGYRLRKE